MNEELWWMVFDKVTGRAVSSGSAEPTHIDRSMYDYVAISQQPDANNRWDEKTRSLIFVPTPIFVPSTIEELKTKPVSDWTQGDRDLVAQHQLNNPSR